VDPLTPIKEAKDSFLAAARLRARCMALRFKCLGHLREYLAYPSRRRENPPVFIVGCGHSGTSFLLAVLGAHSRLCAIPEETRLAYSYITDTPGLDRDADQLVTYFELLANVFPAASSSSSCAMAATSPARSKNGIPNRPSNMASSAGSMTTRPANPSGTMPTRTSLNTRT
jgi:hypothetical protein